MAQCIKDLIQFKEKIPPMPDFDSIKQHEEDGVTVKTDTSGKELTLTATQLQVAIRIYEKEVEVAKKESRSVCKDMTTLCGQVLGQCTPSMRRSLEGRDEWSAIDSTKDPIKLLKAIQSVMCGQQTHQHLPLTLHQSMRGVVNITQGKSNPEDYHKRFVAALEAAESVGTVSLAHPSLVHKLLLAKVGGDPSKITTATGQQRQAARKEAIDRSNATAFLCGLDKQRHGTMVAELANELLKGKDNCPPTVEEALAMAVNYRNSGGGASEAPAQSALLFNQESSRSRGRRGGRRGGGGNKDDDKSKGDDDCNWCGESGHHQHQCDDYKQALEAYKVGKKKTGQAHVQEAEAETDEEEGDEAAELADLDGCTNVQVGESLTAELPMEAFNLANIAQSNFKVLLDNQATTHCFSERALLNDVRDGPARMRIKTNGGAVDILLSPTDDMVADFFTKPLQGSKFLRFRDTILNVQGSQYNVT